MKKLLLTILFLSILGLIQAFLMTQYNPNLIPVEIFFAFGITAFGVFIGLIVFLTDLENKNSKKSTGLLIMALFLIGFGIGVLVSREQNSNRRKNAELIIRKLELYFQQKGNYPENLDNLKPDYFIKIPTSNWGLKKIDFEYQTDSLQKSFWIDYKIGTGCGWTYTSNDGWQFYD